jgi:short-subunit dehydrogenase
VSDPGAPPGTPAAAGPAGDAGSAPPAAAARPLRTALVTGASSGIGAATARLLARQGTTVALVARRADRLAEVLADCQAHAPASISLAADLADVDRARQVARTAWDALGGIDVLVNNAGAPMRRPVERLTLDDVERTMRVNFLSPVAITLELLPDMLARGHGVVVNVSSLGGRLGIMTEAAYSASKFALAGWSEAMAADLAGRGVVVRLVLPGAIATEIWDQPGNDPPLYDGPLEPPEVVAEGIVAAVTSERFEHYLPDMKPVVEMKTADIDAFLAGMRALAGHPTADPASPGAADR